MGLMGRENLAGRRCLELSLPWDKGQGQGQAGPPAPRCSCCRFIKSERSIILLNFCVSILASNILILVGQSQMLSKVGATPTTLPPPPSAGSQATLLVPCWLPAADWIWINSIPGLKSPAPVALGFNRRTAGHVAVSP